MPGHHHRSSVPLKRGTKEKEGTENIMAILVIEGQEHTIEDAFVNLGGTVEESDQMLRNALRGQFDIIANATFRREEKNGTVKITVIKNPGTKGSDRLVSTLLGSNDFINPVYALDCELRMQELQEPFDLPTLLALQPRIRKALQEGSRLDMQASQVQHAFLRTAPMPAVCVPLGF
jgi:hypothetical protein